MSVFRSQANPPAWCELEHFEIVDVDAGRALALPRRSPEERVLITSGYCQAVVGARSQVLREGQFLDMTADETGWEIRGADRLCSLVRLSGRWGKELGGCGLFTVQTGGPHMTKGDPVNYPKNTGFDSHYHDCDEYWLMLEGTGTVVVGKRQFAVEPGDCVAIGMGHHHDFPEVGGPVKAVYFETTLEGQKRIGHLWNHVHGIAEPKADRI